MTKKIIWGSTIAAIFVIITIATIPLAFAPPPSYGVVSSGSVTSNPPGTVHKFTVTTGGAIPHVPDAYITSTGLVTFGWLDGVPGNAVVAAIHPGVVDSTQNPNLPFSRNDTIVSTGLVHRCKI